MRAAADQPGACFTGELTAFRPPSAARGTAFRWGSPVLPYGSTVTYGEIPARLGANPPLIVRPCHRVTGADGSQTGYAGGLDRKVPPLGLEGALEGQGCPSGHPAFVGPVLRRAGGPPCTLRGPGRACGTVASDEPRRRRAETWPRSDGSSRCCCWRCCPAWRR
ncbi:methylated-DNA--[protein]-cysteine S-methyltransferase [Streptomyces lasalocidi]